MNKEPFQKKKLSEEDLKYKESLERIEFNQYIELVKNGSIISRVKKFKKPRTIFYDEEKNEFMYVNPYHGAFETCGKWA